MGRKSYKHILNRATKYIHTYFGNLAYDIKTPEEAIQSSTCKWECGNL